MLFGARIRCVLINPLAGLLLGLFWIQLVAEIVPESWNFKLVTEAQAATGIIRPNANGTVQGLAGTSCLLTGNWSCLDDPEVSPTAPTATNDTVTLTRNQQDYYQMETLTDVSSVSSVAVDVYHVEGSANMQLSVSLWDATETTQYGTTVNFANRTSSQYDTATFSGLSLTQGQLDGLRVRLTCTRPSGGAATDCVASSLYATVTYDPVINVTVGTAGTQQNVDLGATDVYLGGLFSIEGTIGSRNITSITIAEAGTVDAANNLSNIKLFYDLDTSNPYDCASESYAGTESQYGSTLTGGFTSANGSASFSDTVGISPTATMCVYVVVDVGTGATSGETIEVQISNPETDIVGSGTTYITPNTPILLAGTTVIEQAVIVQDGFHWRNDDGSETGATSATGNTENTNLSNLADATTERIRFLVENTGNKTSSAIQYRLEYASTTGLCSETTGWTDVGAVGGDFDMSNSANLTDGNDTTNVAAAANGAITDPGGKTFLATNAAVKDTSSQTAGITLTSTQFVEIEYSIIGSGSLINGTTYCFRLTDAGTELDTYTNYPRATIAADVSVTGTGSESSSITIPSTGNYAGGAFVVTDTVAGADTLSSVTITASGTIDAQNDLSNVILRYDTDTTVPYDCASESYAGTDAQFGTTGSFNGSNQVTFSGSATISPTQTLCLYVEFDVDSDATNGELLDLQIDNASTDLTIAGSTIAPASTVNIPGTADFLAPFLDQRNYHWRNNNGSETGATSATGGSENTIVSDVKKTSPLRLRMAVENTGPIISPATSFQLEWAERVGSCDSGSLTWVALDVGSDEWAMSPSANLTDGADTTDIAEANGGVNNVETTFLSSNGGVKDTSDSTASIAIPIDNYIEFEWSIVATTNATQGATYCFRVTNAGVPIDGYTTYPQASIAIDSDFKVQRGVLTVTASSATLVAGVDYEPPASINNAFIRITNTAETGAGPNTGNSNSNADDVTIFIVNPDNLLNSVRFQRGQFAGGNTRVSWEIIEYIGAGGGENEMIVRHHGTSTYGTAATTVTTGTISSAPTDDADVVVFITGQYNPNAARNDYGQTLSTAAWNGGADTATFTRGATGDAVSLTYAVVEFTGSNWKIQRVSHTYTAVDTEETESITPVNSQQRTFVVAQKHTAGNNHADFGHEVWLSGLGQITFYLSPDAATPGSNTTVAWVIENTQTQGVNMRVSRSNGLLVSTTGGPESNLINIGTTLFSLSAASIFVTAYSDETSRSWPEPIIGVQLVSDTQYELWRSDNSANVDYRTAVVEWPTAERDLEQNYYRLYVDPQAGNSTDLTPSDPWPVGVTDLGENTEMTAADEPLASGDSVRIRMSVTVKNAAVPAGFDDFTLQYAKRVTSCDDVSLSWSTLGEIGSTTAQWRAIDNFPADGTPLSTNPPTGGDLLLSLSTVAGTYNEASTTALNPYVHFPGDEVEYDWVVEHNGADDKSSYCFRMVESNGELFSVYNNYPVVRTVGYDPRITNWRWYDDETNVTPSAALAAENVAPASIENQNALKLRMVLEESSGATGPDAKFSVQYSEYADFSQSVFTVASTTLCTANSLWCYFDGAGVDNAAIQATVISDADLCVAGIGDGCGTHNETISTTTATIDHTALTSMEFEFTIQHAGARAGTVYYFRLYDRVNNEPVLLADGASYPSLVTQGAQLVFENSGVAAGQVIAGLTMDATTSTTSIEFPPLSLTESYEVAQQFLVDTNSTDGYQLYMYVGSQLVNTYGDTIPPVTGSNATPGSWAAVCDLAVATGCFGYHTTDSTLPEPSPTRFAPDDSFAAVSTSPEIVLYSTVPAVDTYYLVYRAAINQLQPAGQYETTITYIAVPSF